MDIRQKIIQLMKDKIREQERKEGALQDNFQKYKAIVKSFASANKEVATEQILNQALKTNEVKFTITTDPKETIDSIIMSQVSGIKPWNIEKKMLDKRGAGHMVVPMWQRTGNIDYVSATRKYRWKRYKPHTKIPFVDIEKETKHDISASTDLSHFQKVIDKLAPWGILNIKVE